MVESTGTNPTRRAWNRGRLIGPKPPLKPRHIWGIRTRLQFDRRVRDLAMFNCAIDSKLRGSDLVKLQVGDVCTSGGVRTRSTIMQKKTGRPVPFEISEPAREALAEWLAQRGERDDQWLFPSRSLAGQHLQTRQYARLVDRQVALVGLDPGSLRHPQPCDAPRCRWCIGGPGTCGPVNFCSVTPSWRAPSATWASRSTTPWRCPNRPKSSSAWLVGCAETFRPPTGSRRHSPRVTESNRDNPATA